MTGREKESWEILSTDKWSHMQPQIRDNVLSNGTHNWAQSVYAPFLPLYKAPSDWKPPALKAESANLTVFITALNIHRRTSTGTCTVYLMIWLNKVGQRVRLPVYFKVQLAGHELKLGHAYQSGYSLARDWRVEAMPGYATLAFVSWELN